MITKFIEATNGPQNWGKFMVARFETFEWVRRSFVSAAPLLRDIGHSPEHVLVLDLQTTEGAFFRPGGLAKADLDKHRIWVCPLFEPFLTWLYQQDLADLDKLPDHVDLPDAPFALAGYRREGPPTQGEHVARLFELKDELRQIADNIGPSIIAASLSLLADRIALDAVELGRVDPTSPLYRGPFST